MHSDAFRYVFLRNGLRLNMLQKIRQSYSVYFGSKYNICVAFVHQLEFFKICGFAGEHSAG